MGMGDENLRSQQKENISNIAEETTLFYGAQVIYHFGKVNKVIRK